MKSGFRKPCEDSFCCKKEQTFWGLEGFVLEDTPVSRVPEHSADRTVSNLQLPGKPVYNKQWGKGAGGDDSVLMKVFSNLK